METIKLYVLEQQEEIKGFVVAKSISEAMHLFQAEIDDDTATEEYFRDFTLISDRVGRADYVAEIRENYKGTSEQRGMATALVSETYDIFELDFSIGRVYGSI